MAQHRRSGDGAQADVTHDPGPSVSSGSGAGEKPATPMAAPAGEAGPHARGLVVDDEAPEDHSAALRVVKRFRCDVALVDLVMPGVNGLQTIEAIRSIQPDIEFI